VEEVGNQEIFAERFIKPVNQLLERNGRGVRRDDRAFLAHGFDLFIKVVLDLQVFKNDLDNPVDIGKVFEVVLDIARGNQLGIGRHHEGGRVCLEHFLDSALGQLVAIVAGIFRHNVEQQNGNARIGNVGGNA